MNISSAKCLEWLTYDEESGELRLRKSTSRRNYGWLATYKHHRGYLIVEIEGKHYPAHQVIWLMKTGEIAEEVDHINHVRDDNRWCNLRAVSHQEQQLNKSRAKNNTSGATGVYPRGKRFCAYIKINKKLSVLGTFDTFEEAVKARKEAEKRLGFHENHGMPKKTED